VKGEVQTHAQARIEPRTSRRYKAVPGLHTVSKLTGWERESASHINCEVLESILPVYMYRERTNQ
jgi:hypothetical protein